MRDGMPRLNVLRGAPEPTLREFDGGYGNGLVGVVGEGGYIHNAAFYSTTAVDSTYRLEAPRRRNRASLGRAPSPSSSALQSAAFKLLID